MFKEKILLLTLIFVLFSFLLCSWTPSHATAYVQNNPTINYLSFHDANLKDVLYLLAKNSGMNIVLDERAMNNEKDPRKITMNLTKIPLNMALDLIVSSAGLTYTRVGNAIVVGEKSQLGKNFNLLLTEKIKLQYADAFKIKDMLVGLGLADYDNIFVYGELNKDKEKSSQDKDKAEGVVLKKSTDSTSNNSNDSGGNKAENLTVSKLSDTRFTELDKANVLPANILIVRDTGANIHRIKEVVKTLDQPAPKIMVEAKVIEINETGMKELGVDWITSDADTGQKMFSSTKFTEIQQPAGTMKLGKYLRSPLNFNALVKAQINNGNAKLLSSPKISTLEGKPAFIYVGDKVPYISSRDTDEENNKSKITTKVSFLNSGVTLEILPLLADNQDIQLKIYSEVSSIKEWKKIDTIEYPIPSMRQAETITRVRAGESIILGGLIYDEEKKSMSKLPLLGDIPLLKSLFSWSSSDKSRSEVVISLTPYIVN